MRQGTTPTHIFELDIDTSLIQSIKLIYFQRNRKVLTKNTEDFSVEPGQISVKLSQEDTFLFEGNVLVTLQLRILTQNGDALCADPIVLTVAKCLDDEVLV